MIDSRELTSHMKNESRKISKKIEKLEFEIARKAYDIGHNDGLETAWSIMQAWNRIDEKDREKYEKGIDCVWYFDDGLERIVNILEKMEETKNA